jgi:putative chitinase
MKLKLTTAILMTGTGCDTTTAGTWLAPLQSALDQFDVTDSAQSVAAFLANVGVESNGFRTLAENLNYSAVRLAQVWPQRYAVNPHVSNLIPNDTATRIANNPQAIANNVYANRMGNGPEASGDGWNFRGMGPIQLTGRTEYLKFFAAIDEPVNTETSELMQPTFGSMSAAWFWTDSGADKNAIAGNFAASVEDVNGQSPCAANQGPQRQSRYDAVLPLCEAAATAANPPAQAPKTPKAKAATSGSST